MYDILMGKGRTYLINSLIEWVAWIGGSVLVVMFIKWCTIQYGAPEYEFHVWISSTLYLWYVSTMSLIIGVTYFVARSAQTHLERRQSHPQKPKSIDLTNDIKRVRQIKNRAGGIALLLYTLNAVLVYYVSRHIPGITPEFRIYAVVGVFAVAAIKPGFCAINTIRLEIFGMLREADYPVKSVAELWQIITQFGNYEERLEKTFEEIETIKEENTELIEEKLVEMEKSLQGYRGELEVTFQNEVTNFKKSDDTRQRAYNELKNAQVPVTKEISKVLAEIQTLKDYIIELRDKNIKGEQLMSALKEFGIDSLAELNVTFEKSVGDLNPSLQEKVRKAN